MNASKLVLVTGGSGYIGGYIVQQLLDAGYPVRLTARPGKEEMLKAMFPGNVDVFTIADIVTGDYTQALEGVHAIVHVAAPIRGPDGAAAFIDLTVNSTMNILSQSVVSGVKKAIITSSCASVLSKGLPGKVYTEHDWITGTREQAQEEGRGHVFAYGVAKKITEQTVFKFADEHPEIDITIINPPFVFGPIMAKKVIPVDDFEAFSTVYFFFRNVLPVDPFEAEVTPGAQDIEPLVVDVRDVARAHVLALNAPPASQVGRKRIMINGPSYTWWDAVKHLRKVRPDLNSRFPKVIEGEQDVVIAKLDLSRARAVLGLEDYIDWRKTVEDTLDSILEIEKNWARKD